MEDTAVHPAARQLPVGCLPAGQLPVGCLGAGAGWSVGAVAGAGWSVDAVTDAGPAVLAGWLAGARMDELDFGQATAALTAVGQVSNWLDGCRAGLLNQLAVQALVDIPTGSAPGPSRSQTELAYSVALLEAATTLRLPEGNARRLLDESTALAGTYQRTLALLSAGKISHAHAEVIIDQGRELGPADQERLETRVLERAPELTRTQLRERAHRYRCKLDPSSMAARRMRAATDRRLYLDPAPDGMAWLNAFLPAETAIAAYNRVSAAARALQGPGQSRTLAQLRAGATTGTEIIRQYPDPAAPAQLPSPVPLPSPLPGRAPTRHASRRRGPTGHGRHGHAGTRTGSGPVPGRCMSGRASARLLRQCQDRMEDAARRGRHDGPRPATGPASGTCPDRICTICHDPGCDPEQACPSCHEPSPNGPGRNEPGRNGHGCACWPQDPAQTRPQTRPAQAPEQAPEQVPAQAPAGESSTVPNPGPGGPDDATDTSAPPDAGAPVDGEDIDYSRFRAEIFITIPVLSAIGADDAPGFLEGYGPIPADVARKIIAAQPSFYRVLTDADTGARLSLGRKTYRPGADLARAVRLANPTCGFVGCRTTARNCELDHVLDWAKGGATNLEQLRPGCKHHHRLKHLTSWSATALSGGALQWRSPGGKTYTTHPDDLDTPPF